MKRDILDWGEAQGIKWKFFKFWMGFEGCPSTKLQDGTFMPLLNMLKEKFNIVKRTGWNQTATTGLTKLSIFATNLKPAVNESYTAYGFLKDVDGKALVNKSVDLWYRYEGEGTGKPLQTLTTDATGKWQMQLSSEKFTNLRAVFSGDATLKNTKSDLMLITPLRPATLTLESGTPTPKVGETYYLFGQLIDTETKELMVNAAVNIWVRHTDEKVGRFWKTMMTDKNGKYMTPAVSSAPAFVRTVFMPGTIHAQAYSNLIEITPK